MKKGFSLVELSVVLVIIGILIGGVVAGSSLITNSKIQAVASDFSKYSQAAISFKEKYYFWPGDQPDATSVWNGVANGDGNGAIGSTSGGIGTSGEVYSAMQVMSLAKFINGSYNGSGVGGVQPGINFPAAPLEGASGNRLKMPVYVYVYTDLNSLNKNVLAVTDIASNNTTQQGAYRPDESLAIDAKIDDGLAATGVVRGLDSTSTCLGGGIYDIANSGSRKCVVAYLLEM